MILDIQDIERFVYKFMEECHRTVTDSLRRKLTHLILGRSGAFLKSRRDPKYKEEVARYILNNIYPEIEAMIKCIGSLEPESIAKMRDAMMAHSLAIDERSE
ncbi:hypothetical protein TWF481_003821 [Arthrobotrys musiformis]|uniref:Uncharacterized protein n=1 Tax=Arthrobotrys musiformis TaxID=47236 RepID=A0AAV9WJR9_9PEZI